MKRLATLGVCATCCLTNMASAATAQVAKSTVQPLTSAESGATASGFDNRVIVEAGDSDAKATARVAGFFGEGATLGRYSLTVSAPFDRKKADHVDVGTLSGLSAGTSAAAELSWIHWPQAPANATPDIEGACQDVIAQVLPGFSWRAVKNLLPKDESICDETLMDMSRLGAIATALKAAVAECADPGLAVRDAGAKRRCDAATTQLRVATLPPVELSPDAEAILRVGRRTVGARVLEASKANLLLVTLGARTNQQRFTYVTETSPDTAQKVTRSGNGASLSVTGLHLTWLWSAGYAHEQSYQAGDTAQICMPLPGTQATSCSEAIVGAPTKRTKELAFGEMRWLFNRGDGTTPRFAIAPRVEYDFKQSDWAARVPIYFVSNSEGALTAGVALGYSHRDDDFGASVFISKPFAFLD